MIMMMAMSRCHLLVPYVDQCGYLVLYNDVSMRTWLPYDDDVQDINDSCFLLFADRPLHYDDFEGDSDALFEFSCPFCYVEYDIGSLCSHLEEEHRFESKSVVCFLNESRISLMPFIPWLKIQTLHFWLLQICPVCAARAGTDVVGHITHQHGHLFKISFSISLVSSMAA